MKRIRSIVIQGVKKYKLVKKTRKGLDADVDKVIDMSKTVYDLSKDYPEIIGLLDELGFHDIVKPGMIQTAGRFMTLPKGAMMKKISLENVKQVLKEKGYRIKEEN